MRSGQRQGWVPLHDTAGRTSGPPKLSAVMGRQAFEQRPCSKAGLFPTVHQLRLLQASTPEPAGREMKQAATAQAATALLLQRKIKSYLSITGVAITSCCVCSEGSVPGCEPSLRSDSPAMSVESRLGAPSVFSTATTATGSVA